MKISDHTPHKFPGQPISIWNVEYDFLTRWEWTNLAHVSEWQTVDCGILVELM